jgi:hypothetical protein
MVSDSKIWILLLFKVNEVSSATTLPGLATIALPCSAYFCARGKAIAIDSFESMENNPQKKRENEANLKFLDWLKISGNF